MSQQSNNVFAGMGNPATRSNNISAAQVLVGSLPTGIVWRSVGDLSSGYTFSDPNALLSSYSYNSGTDEHTFNVVTVNPAVADYAINSAPNFTGPRWYRDLTDATGALLNTDNRFIMLVKFSNISFAGGITQWGAYCGAIQVPSSTVLLTMQSNGIWSGVTGAGTPNAGAHAVNVASTVSLANATSIRGSMIFGGLPFREKTGPTVLITSATGQDSVLRADGAAWTASATPSLFICLTTLGTVVTTAGSITAKIEYAVLRMS